MNVDYFTSITTNNNHTNYVTHDHKILSGPN